MVEASELEVLSPVLALWRADDPEVKAELSSAALRSNGAVYLVDPIPLHSGALSRWSPSTTVAGVFVTNVNHARAALAFATENDAPIRASAVTANKLPELKISATGTGEKIGEKIVVIAIEGAAEGEIALHFNDEDGGAIILGDALIHFGSDGFALLPEKYCTDQRQLKRSLRQLLDFSFTRLLFAHGQPIVTEARRRLEELLH